MATRVRLDELVLSRGLAHDLREARGLILAGRVRVEGEVITEAGRRVSPDCELEVERPSSLPSRAGEKLQNLFTDLPALARAIAGRVCLDLGAAHGGFTAVLLDHGARLVMAVDVGYGLMAPELRRDPRVVVMERTNLRDLAPEDLPQPPSLITSDLSFISQRRVADLAQRLSFAGLWIGLFKPQFEIPKEKAHSTGVKKGVVVDPRLAQQAWESLSSYIEKYFTVKLIAPARPLGREGNREFFFLAWRGEEPPPMLPDLPPAGLIIQQAYRRPPGPEGGPQGP